MSVALFVYGTLGPGQEAWSLIAPYVQEHRAAAVPGRLYDTGRGYPGAVFGPGDDLVQGWCCTLIGTSLDALDEFEGDEYERVTVRCTDGTEAFGYRWIVPVDSPVASIDGGEWLPGGSWADRRVT